MKTALIISTCFFVLSLEIFMFIIYYSTHEMILFRQFEYKIFGDHDTISFYCSIYSLIFSVLSFTLYYRGIRMHHPKEKDIFFIILSDFFAVNIVFNGLFILLHFAFQPGASGTWF